MDVVKEQQKIPMFWGDIGSQHPELLKKLGLIRDEKKPVKVLAKIEGELSKKLVIKVDKFSAKVEELIKASGGSIECLTR